jgi:hypothetical protein
MGKREIPCPYWELNHDSSTAQPTAKTLWGRVKVNCCAINYKKEEHYKKAHITQVNMLSKIKVIKH